MRERERAKEQASTVGSEVKQRLQHVGERLQEELKGEGEAQEGARPSESEYGAQVRETGVETEPPVQREGIAFLGLERESPRVVVTLSWSRLAADEDFSEVVRDKPTGAGGYGKEHEVFVRLYGKERVGAPEVVKAGPRAFHRLRFDAGPGPDEGTVGAAYLAELRGGEGRWKFKVRASFPREEREKHQAAVEKLLEGLRAD